MIYLVLCLYICRALKDIACKKLNPSLFQLFFPFICSFFTYSFKNKLIAEMDLSSSELSSGCESGWTIYFDQFSDSSHQYNKHYSRKVEDDEDLSMVSDASSAPPHFHEENNCFYRPPEPTKSNRKKEKAKGKQQHSHLDDSDTATSPVVNFYKHAPGFSQDLSATNVKEKSSYSRKHFGFFKSSKK